MLFSISDIEQQFSESLLLQAEMLLDQQAVENLFELEKHLWIAQVSGQEVEMQISPSKVKALTCDCKTFQSKGGCAHVVAGLMALRRHLRNSPKPTEARNSSNNRTKTTPHKLTIPKILENVEREELLDFIRQYARTNRNFALALKARFAGNVLLSDDRLKYRQLLDSVISNARNKKDQLSYRATQKIIKIAQELIAQAEQAAVAGDPNEALNILEALVEKIAPVIKKAAGLEDKLENLMEQTFQKFDAILDQDIAPALKQRIWDFLTEESKKSVYLHSFPCFLHIFKLLQRLAEERAQMVALRKLMDFMLHRKKLKPSFRAKLHVWTFELLQRENKSSEAEEYLILHLHEPEFLLFATHQAYNYGEYERAKFLAHQGLQDIQQSYIKEELTEVLFQIAKKEEKPERIHQYALQRFLSTKDKQYFEVLRETMPENWDDTLEEVINALKKQPYSLKKRDVLAFIFETTGKTPELLEYIRELKSLDLLVRYDYLFKHQKDIIKELYLDMTLQYLRSHIGRKTSQKVRETLQHLYQSGNHELGNFLLDRFKQEFPERHTLMEELEVFQY